MAEPELLITIRVHELGPADKRFEASLADYPLVESGRTPWEAVNRLVGAHRALLVRRWGVMLSGSDRCRRDVSELHRMSRVRPTLVQRSGSSAVSRRGGAPMAT